MSQAHTTLYREIWREHEARLHTVSLEAVDAEFIARVVIDVEKAKHAAQGAGGQEIEDLRQRFEMAVQDVRELKSKNAELSDQLAKARQAGGSPAAGDLHRRPALGGPRRGAVARGIVAAAGRATAPHRGGVPERGSRGPTISS